MSLKKKSRLKEKLKELWQGIAPGHWFPVGASPSW
jgi:hypothetical protein